MLPSNFTKKSFLYLSFLKQFLSEDSNPCVLITLNNQSTSNESNSASWNGQHRVFPSNFTNKSFFIFGFFKKPYIGRRSPICPDDYLLLMSIFLYLSFFKQFRSKESVPYILITLNSQCNMNESNSACWNCSVPEQFC